MYGKFINFVNEVAIDPETAYSISIAPDPDAELLGYSFGTFQHCMYSKRERINGHIRRSIHALAGSRS